MTKDKRLMVKKRSELPIENILASYLDERNIELSPNEEKLKIRYETVFKMLIKKDSIFSTVKKHMKVFEVSMATAYRDIKAAESIFGAVKKFDKEAWRFIQIERKRKLIKMAMESNDYEVASKIERDIDNLIGFDKEDAIFNPEKLANMKITIGMPDWLIKAYKNNNNKGVVDLNDFEAEDIDYTEVKEDE